MADKEMYKGDTDPEIAELLGLDDEDDGSAPNLKPDFQTLFDEKKAGSAASQGEALDEFDETRRFDEIFEDEQKPQPYFSDKAYYQKAISGCGDNSKRLHQILAQFLNAEDPQERSMHRNKLIPAYWNFLEEAVSGIFQNMSTARTLTIRFGALLPTAITQAQRIILTKIVFDKKTREPIFYIDEWFREVALGNIQTSATDEIKIAKASADQKNTQKIEAMKGLRESVMIQIRSKMTELTATEKLLQEKVAYITQHAQHHSFPDLKKGYHVEQKKALSEINSLVKQASSQDKEVEGLYFDLEKHDTNYQQLLKKAGMADNGGKAISSDDLLSEFRNIRQMHKLSVGRQGNHIPILMANYFKSNLFELAVRENVLKILKEVEELDPDLFVRVHKRQRSRIVPYIILLPSYGDSGFCWQAYDRYNKATSRGRIAIPMYPKKLKEAVLSALADLRWQVAKEKAQHYWMEEGLTGKYYQWFSDVKLKGDVKEYFIQDYITWITWESNGTQKLNREVRAVFWRHVPFPQELKDSLKNRGFVYSELYKRDLNRALSDGY